MAGMATPKLGLHWLFDELNGVPTGRARRYELNPEGEPSAPAGTPALTATGVSDEATPQGFLGDGAADPSGLTTTAPNLEPEEQGAPQVGMPPLFAKNDPLAGPVADGTPSLVHRLLQGDKLGQEPSLCRCPSCSTLRVSGGAVETASTAVAAAGTVAALSLLDTFKLHSNPLASKSIYLDFDGYLIAAGSAWSTNYNGGKAINAPAWSIDADPTSFNDAERAVIQGIWQRVAEDYAPFNIDVTTEFLGEDYLTRSSSSDQIYGTRALISPISSYFGSYGGIAYVNVFGYVGDTYKPALIFPENLGPNGEKYIAEAISHEVGHNLGLSHDGTSSQGYYTGQGSGETGWAPIMGVGYYQPLSQWSQGEYADANQKQDDLAIISGSTNGFGYRTDAAGNNALSAASLGVAGANATNSSLVDVFQFGIIETRGDLDWYGFSTGVGAISFSVGAITQSFINSPSGYLSSYVTAPAGSTNLDIWAGLYATNGTTLLSSWNPLNELGASFSYNITIAGTYYLAIDGVGKGDPLTTGYSDYGSLGQYLISGTIVAPAALPGIVVTPTAGLTTTEAGGTASFSVVLASAPTAAVTIGVSSTKTNEGTPDKTTLTFTTSNWNVAQTVTVTGVDDQLIDGAQAYQIRLAPATSSDSAYNGLDADDVSLTNLDNDLPLPLLSISSGPQTVVEGQTTSVTYTVSLSGPSQAVVSVNYATSDGTAIAGSDYSTTSGTLSFGVGETIKTITIDLLNDSISEPDETFKLTLSAPTNATLGSPSDVTTTITDTLVASSTTTLAAGIENLQLTGTSDINGTGNSGANVITGNSGANVLKGGGGIDVLTGLGGRDTFDLSGLSNAANRCTITDFDPITGEIIRLSNSLTSPTGGTASLATFDTSASIYSLNTGSAGNDIFAFKFDSSATLAGVTNGSALLDGLIGSGSASLRTSTRGGKGYLLAYDNGDAFLYAFNAGGGNTTSSTTVNANEIALIATFDNSSAINPGAFLQTNFSLV